MEQIDDYNEDDILSNLGSFFDYKLDKYNATDEELSELFKKFIQDFKVNPPLVKGKPLNYKKNIERKPFNKNFPEGFVHCITKDYDKNKRRFWDCNRAQRLHWIKPIIENASDPRIFYFEAINDKGFNQLFYWFKEKQFIVIIRELEPENLLITSFYVDSRTSFDTYNDQYNTYIGQKKTPLRK